MRIVAHPKTEEIDLARVLHALSDSARLDLVQMLADGSEKTCGALCKERPKSSMSYHFRTLITAGVLQVRAVGTVHWNSLRLQDLNARFPGLISVILAAKSKV